MTKKRIFIYTLLSFLPVYAGTILYKLCGGEYGNIATQVLLMFFMFCPAVAVFFTIKLTKEDIRMTGEHSLNLGFSCKGKKVLWVIAGILLPVLYTDLGYGLYYLLFPNAYDLGILDALGIECNLLWLVPISQIISSIMLSFGGLGEEIGWRSYLYPKLEELFGESRAVLIGGVIWSVWHFPLICIGHNFGTDYFGAPWTGFFVFTIYCIAAGGIFYYFTKKTGSVWVAAFMHAIHNSIGSASILRMILTREGVPAFAKESTVELLILAIPMIALGLVLWLIRFGNKKK